MARWFFFEGGEVQGPFSDEEIVALKTAGTISGDTNVCREGEESWDTFSQAFARPDVEARGEAVSSRVSPPPLPLAGPVEAVPTKRRKWVIASKVQIAAAVLLAILGLLKLLAIRTDGTTSVNTQASSRFLRNTGSLIPKIDSALEQFLEYARLQRIGRAHGPSMNAEQRQKFLEEFTLVGTEIQRLLTEISREATNLNCPADLRNRVTLLGGSAWLQNDQFAAYNISTLQELRSWISRSRN